MREKKANAIEVYYYKIRFRTAYCLPFNLIEFSHFFHSFSLSLGVY
jgi:hypothetical protein